MIYRIDHKTFKQLLINYKHIYTTITQSPDGTRAKKTLLSKDLLWQQMQSEINNL